MCPESQERIEKAGNDICISLNREAGTSLYSPDAPRV
jgi:hypothetical protein